LPEDLFKFHEAPGNYLAFLGRISPEKRVDRAIEIAKLAGLPLKIAAKVDRVDQDYFNAVIKPLLDPSMVEFIGEIGGKEKEEFLGNAYALLFPIDWPEPFGLVMIEAMACGTPVIAWPHGSVPEVLEDGDAGFVVEGIEEAARAVERLAGFDRRRCREVFDRRYTAARMAGDYVNIYEQLLEKDPVIEFRMAEYFRNQEVFASA
jgi:glycosyltransferase involved in cell wall biosynthesis